MGTPCSLRGGDVEAEQHRRRAVDRHRGGDLVERNAVEQGLHVGQAGDRDAALPDLALGAGMVGVVAHQRGKVEGHREPGLTPLQQELVALVGVFGGAEPGELAHGPEPAAVHRRVDAAGERDIRPAARSRDFVGGKIERRCTPARRCGPRPR